MRNFLWFPFTSGKSTGGGQNTQLAEIATGDITLFVGRHATLSKGFLFFGTVFLFFYFSAIRVILNGLLGTTVAFLDRFFSYVQYGTVSYVRYLR